MLRYMLYSEEKLRSDCKGLAGRQRTALERGTKPSRSRRPSSPRHGLHSCQRDWAGVVKRRRESLDC